jgi:hypothetical protein
MFNKFKKGQSVVVNPNVKDYVNADYTIGGWQGRIIDIHEDKEGVFIEVQWDSITLRNMPEEYLEESVNEDLEYESYVLDPNDIQVCEPRDEESDVHKAVSEIEKTYFEFE